MRIEVLIPISASVSLLSSPSKDPFSHYISRASCREELGLDIHIPKLHFQLSDVQLHLLLTLSTLPDSNPLAPKKKQGVNGDDEMKKDSTDLQTPARTEKKVKKGTQPPAPMSVASSSTPSAASVPPPTTSSSFAASGWVGWASSIASNILGDEVVIGGGKEVDEFESSLISAGESLVDTLTSGSKKEIKIFELLKVINIKFDGFSLTLQKRRSEALKSTSNSVRHRVVDGERKAIFVPVPTSIAPLGFMQVFVDEDEEGDGTPSTNQSLLTVTDLLNISVSNSLANMCMVSNSATLPALDMSCEVSEISVTNLKDTKIPSHISHYNEKILKWGHALPLRSCLHEYCLFEKDDGSGVSVSSPPLPLDEEMKDRLGSGSVGRGDKCDFRPCEMAVCARLILPPSPYPTRLGDDELKMHDVVDEGVVDGPEGTRTEVEGETEGVSFTCPSGIGVEEGTSSGGSWIDFGVMDVSLGSVQFLYNIDACDNMLDFLTGTWTRKDGSASCCCKGYLCRYTFLTPLLSYMFSLGVIVSMTDEVHLPQSPPASRGAHNKHMENKSTKRITTVEAAATDTIPIPMRIYLSLPSVSVLSPVDLLEVGDVDSVDEREIFTCASLREKGKGIVMTIVGLDANMGEAMHIMNPSILSNFMHSLIDMQYCIDVELYEAKSKVDISGS